MISCIIVPDFYDCFLKHLSENAIEQQWLSDISPTRNSVLF